MLGFILGEWRRTRLERMAFRDPARVWQLARRAWSRASTIHLRPTSWDASRRRDLLLLRSVVMAVPDAEGLLSAGLEDPAPGVAAYCLVGLCYLRSERVAMPPAALLERPERLRWVTGTGSGTITEQTLGERARFESEVALAGHRSITAVALDFPLRREDWDRIHAAAQTYPACARCGTRHFDFQSACPGCGAPIGARRG